MEEGLLPHETGRRAPAVGRPGQEDRRQERVGGSQCRLVGHGSQLAHALLAEGALRRSPLRHPGALLGSPRHSQIIAYSRLPVWDSSGSQGR